MTGTEPSSGPSVELGLMNQQIIATRANASHFGPDLTRRDRGGRIKKNANIPHETAGSPPHDVTESPGNRSKETLFYLDDREATEVMLLGDFTDWERRPIRMTRDDNGVWLAKVPLLTGAHYYRFIVDGQWRDDPGCNERVATPFGSSNAVRHVA